MWYKIIEIADWFGEMAERYRLVKDFNKAALVVGAFLALFHQ